MNAGHMEFCASEDWRRMVHDTILPVALRGVELGDDAIEIGPGPGFTTDVLRTMTAALTAVEIDEGLAAVAGRADGWRATSTSWWATRPRWTSPATVSRAPPRSTCCTTSRPADAAGPRLRRAGPGARPRRRPGGGRRRPTPRAARSFHEGDTYNPIDPDELEPRLGAAGFATSRCVPTTSGGCARPAPAEVRPEMIVGRASLPGRDHLARLRKIVTTADRCRDRAGRT